MGAVQKERLAAEPIRVRHCHTLAEFEACVELERRVWGGSDLEVVPSTIFVVTAETGGQVLGAFSGSGERERMVGFTLAFPAMREEKPFLHSHMTAVLPDYQNRGIGYRLKLTQRRDALRRGIELVEWTFDPLELRNAYFNLSRLGAIVRRYLPDHYGITQSPLHAGLPTDRLVAEWWLASPRVKRALVGAAAAGRRAGRQAAGGKTARIAVPRAIGELKKSRPQEARKVQERVREEFRHWFSRRYVVTGIELTADTGHYILREPPIDGLALDSARGRR